MAGGVAVNDDAGLEREADVMGESAAATYSGWRQTTNCKETERDRPLGSRSPSADHPAEVSTISRRLPLGETRAVQGQRRNQVDQHEDLETAPVKPLVDDNQALESHRCARHGAESPLILHKLVSTRLPIQRTRKGKLVGASSSLMVGAVAGALIGSLFPGIGTVLGGILGGLIGAIGGGFVGNLITGKEQDANRRELGEKTTDLIRAEQEEWAQAANDNRMFLHGVTDYSIPHYSQSGATRKRIDQMNEKLRKPEVLQELFISTTLMDKVHGVVSDWTGSGLVLNVPKQNIFAAASTDLAVRNDAIRKPGGLWEEINRMRNSATLASSNRVERQIIEARQERASEEEIARLRGRVRSGLPKPSDIIADTGRGQHNEVAVVGKAPTGEVVTGAGYYILRSFNGEEITSGSLFTSKERETMLHELAKIKQWPVYYINGNCDTQSRKIISIRGVDLSKVGMTVKVEPRLSL